MGLFDRWFGKKASPPVAPEPTDVDNGDVDNDDEDDLEGSSGPRGGPIEGPPDFVRAAEMQRAYWTHNPQEQHRLEARGVEKLGFSDLLRLHHLTCLERLRPGADRAANEEKLRPILRRLLSEESPYRPRSALVWQGKPSQDREPDMLGQLSNPSLTHLGGLEVYRLDAQLSPVKLDFVGFDELSGVLFASPSLIRAAKLFHEDGREEMVMVPLLYGLTWDQGDEHDRSGRMTRFLCHLRALNTGEMGAPGASGIGVGQHDLTITSPDGGMRMFGLGSVVEILFPLDMRDPRFDEKARRRGMDPEAIRRRAH